ncbi:MAG: hypothetical protein GWO20_19780, partial [Candidatus Korarchaeota archaeon]|nr:hypothetical protein [Candidatus Korarchaeota archaeon]
MQVDAVENALFSVAVNPFVKFLISRLDKECGKDGNLLLNSLRKFIGSPVALCPTCQHMSSRIASPFYEIGSLLLRVDKGFMRSQFLEGQYSDAWLRGFGLMMKGIEKYGVRIPFTPAGPFEIVWNFTYKCNLKCKHCYENAGGEKRPELSTDEAEQV